MTTPTASEANSVSTTNHDAVMNTANQTFISSANALIANAQQLGLFKVSLNIVKYMNLQYIQTYFTDLGYNVIIPNQLYTNNQPAQLFGEFWVDYWTRSTFLAPHLTDYQITLTWKNPTV